MITLIVLVMTCKIQITTENQFNPEIKYLYALN